MPLPTSIHHERQHLSSLCALYSINNFLQRSAYTAADLNAISKEFNSSGSSQWHHIPLIGQYDVNVIMVALQRQGYDVQWLNTSSKQPVDFSQVEGLLVNSRNWYGLGRHWYVVRRFGDADSDQWVNVDSKLKAPEVVPTITAFVEGLRKQSDTHILTVRRTVGNNTPESADVQSSTADVDTSALSHAFAAASVDSTALPPSSMRQQHSAQSASEHKLPVNQ